MLGHGYCGLKRPNQNDLNAAMTSARLGEEDDGVDAVVVLTGWGWRVSGWERGVGCGDDAGPLLGWLARAGSAGVALFHIFFFLSPFLFSVFRNTNNF